MDNITCICRDIVQIHKYEYIVLVGVCVCEFVCDWYLSNSPGSGALSINETHTSFVLTMPNRFNR